MCIRVQLGLEWLDDIASWIFGQRKKEDRMKLMKKKSLNWVGDKKK